MLEHPVFPTPFYETVMCVLFFGVLWMLRKRISIPGVLFFVYLFLNGIERFLIESIRVNEKINFLGMQVTQAQLISGTFLLAGIVGIVYLLRKNKAGTPAA
jgi:prolipoprotein diacylglyceryltransferase